QMWRDQCPLGIVQPEIVRHDSGPPGQFESQLGNQFNWVQNLDGQAQTASLRIIFAARKISDCY
ncbi:MAG: hypothetical protein ACREDT_03280, partial [Methylocella sp.]